MKNISLILLALLLSLGAKAQNREIERQTDVWFLLLNHYEISDKVSVGNELHWRNTNFLSDKEQFILRPFLNFTPKKGIMLTGGYSYIRSYFLEENSIAKPEHNIWEQVVLSHELGKAKFSHRYRVEHRFQGQIVSDDGGNSYQVDGYQFSNRFRYRLTMKYPLGEQYFLHLFDEVWVKTDKVFQYPAFDRNWIYLGVGRKVFENGNIQLAYMAQSIRKSADLYASHPTLQLTLQYDFK